MIFPSFVGFQKVSDCFFWHQHVIFTFFGFRKDPRLFVSFGKVWPKNPRNLQQDPLFTGGGPRQNLSIKKRSIATYLVRGPLGIGLIQFLMETKNDLIWLIPKNPKNLPRIHSPKNHPQKRIGNPFSNLPSPFENLKVPHPRCIFLPWSDMGPLEMAENTWVTGVK